MPRRCSALAVALLLAWPLPASAQDSARDEARRHFELGLGHFDRQEWSAALAEFLRSRALYPTVAATKDAAICLRKVGRFDEALDLFDAALSFPDLSPGERALVQKERDDLASSVGTLEVRGAADGALVEVDGRERGTSPLPPFRVSAGTRVVRVAKKGFAPFEVTIDVAGGQRAVVDAMLVSLEPKERIRLVEVTPPARLVLELDAAALGAPVFGGAPADGCTSSCSGGLPLGGAALVRGAYRFASGFALGLDVGYLRMWLKTSGRPAAVTPTGLQPDPGSIDDHVSLGGLVLGGSGSLRLGTVWPVTFRLGAGALLGSLTDDRYGAFTDSTHSPFSAALPASSGATYLYAAPEVRVGWAPDPHLELSAGIAVVVLAALSQPSADKAEIPTGADGEGSYGSETLAGRTIVAVAPGLGAAYAF
jgi:PEGA domain-containing protein